MAEQMMARSFTKRPVTIEAMQWTGNNVQDLWEWVGADNLYGPLPVGDPLSPDGSPARLYVAANDAWLDLDVGEWIIRDRLGFYPCKAEMFRASYSFDDGEWCASCHGAFPDAEMVPPGEDDGEWECVGCAAGVA